MHKVKNNCSKHRDLIEKWQHKLSEKIHNIFNLADTNLKIIQANPYFADKCHSAALE